jgi:hypothetical protein
VMYPFDWHGRAFFPMALGGAPLACL